MGDMAIQDLQQNVYAGIDNTVVFCRVDPEGAVIEAQSAAETPPEKYFPRDHTEIVRRCLESAVSVRNVHSGSDFHTFLWDYFPVKDESCVHMYGTTIQTGMYDMKVFESIPDDHFLFQSLYRAPDAVIVYDGSRKILFANLKLTTLTGYHALELVGKPIETIIPVKYLKRHPLIHELPEGEASQVRDRLLLRKNSTIVEVESSEQVLPNDRYELILRDHSHRRRFNREFSEAIRREIYEKLYIKLRLFKHGEGMVMNLSRLALFIVNAHRLDNRRILDRFIVAAEEYQNIIYSELNSICNMLRVIGHEDTYIRSSDYSLPDGDRVAKYSKRLRSLLGDFLKDRETNDLDKWLRFLDKHKHEINGVITDIISDMTQITRSIEHYFICSPAEIIKMIVNKYHSGKTGVPIRVTDSLSGQPVIMNGSEFGEVMEIFIENACEEIGNQQRQKHDIPANIEIRLSQRDGKIRIEIEDNGPGVPKEYQSVIFNEGFTTKGPGHGFGLRYSASCIRKYGGEVSYEPRDESSGARFVIDLLCPHHE
jgi:PAS domain S-box-containing protein